MNILLAPHNDDETLFASYAVMQYQPVVIIVTDSFRQFKRGTGITWEQRRLETTEALGFLHAPVVFAGIPDDELTLERLLDRLDHIRIGLNRNITRVFAPARQGGNPDHDIVAKAAIEFYGSGLVTRYATYAKDEWFTPIEGYEAIMPNHECKRRALNCYRSQQFQPHFKAVLGQPEYYSDLYEVL